MTILKSTGEVARLLGTTEPTLSELVRRGRIEPAPTILAGRRLWAADHISQAAAALGLATPDGTGPLAHAEMAPATTRISPASERPSIGEDGET